MAASRVEDIYLHLKGKGVNVYFPAQHIGECLEPYVVVKASVHMPYLAYSTEYAVYDLLIYVPQDRYSTIESYADMLRGYMKELMPTMCIRETHYQGIPYYEAAIKAHMVSIEYRVYRKIHY